MRPMPLALETIVKVCAQHWKPIPSEGGRAGASAAATATVIIFLVSSAVCAHGVGERFFFFGGGGPVAPLTGD